MDVQVFVFEEEADEEPFEAREEPPVEEPKVIADGVSAEVGELGPAALALRESIAAHSARADLARHEFERLQLPENVGRQ